jgi:hypothetical protein
MAQVTTQRQTSTSTIPKIIGVILIVLVLVMLGWLLLGNALDTTESTSKPPVTNHGQNSNPPDQAKQQSGDNNDTVPSPNGGSSNSILGQ